MDRKHSRVIEGQVYVFSLPKGQDKASITDAIEDALETSKCGRVLGSGTSLFDDGTVSIEIAASDCDAADATVSRACSKLKCRDFEVIWD